MFWFRQTQPESACVPHHDGGARNLAFVIFALAPFVFGALAVFLGQDANWDLRNYHWYNAYAFLNGRLTSDLLPSQTPFFYNPTLDAPFYLLATHVAAKTAGFILGAVQGLNFILLFMLAHATLVMKNASRKVLVCAGLAMLGMLGGGGIAQIGTTFYDNVTSLGLFASALVVICRHQTLMRGEIKKAATIALLAGVLAGMMMGLKLPSVIFCVGLCAAFLFMPGLFGRRMAVGFLFGVGVLIGVAVTLGHWAWFLQTHYGSPLFPYFNNFFQSPYAPLTSARDVQFVPSGWDRWFFPFVFADCPFRVGEIAWRDWRIPMLYALLPAAIAARFIFARRKTPEAIAEDWPARYLLWSSAIAYGVWLFLFAIYRYIVPLEMLAPLLIVVAVGLLPIKIKARVMVAATALLIVALSVQPGNWTRRDDWLSRFVEVEWPDLPDRPHPMILMAGFEPYSHVVPSFPSEATFVRVQSNFASPDEGKGINRLIRARIDAHKGPFMLLIPSWQHEMAQKALEEFDLTFLPQTCQKVVDHLYESKLDLCDVKPAPLRMLP